MYYTKYVINYYNVLAVHLKYLASYALVWAHELKYARSNDQFYSGQVALCVSAWIEILWLALKETLFWVALRVSAWIEIGSSITYGGFNTVALCVSAWIEIGVILDSLAINWGCTLCKSKKPLLKSSGFFFIHY